MPLLPAIYVAWADGELDGAEMASLRDRVAAVDGIEDACLDALEGWLNPSSPPSPAELMSLLSKIRRLAADIDAVEKLDLATLGR